MKIFLLSESIISVRENNIKTGCTIDTNNMFLDNLKRLCKDAKNFVFVPNNPSTDMLLENLDSAIMVYESLISAVGLKNCIVLDKHMDSIEAKAILQNADVVYLQGGVIKEQNDFLKQIDF